MTERHTRLIAYQDALADRGAPAEDPVAAAKARHDAELDAVSLRDPGVWTAEQLRRVIEMATQYLAPVDIEDATGIPEHEIVVGLKAVSRKLEAWCDGKRKAKTRYGEKAMRDAQVTEAAELHLMGYGWAQVAEALDLRKVVVLHVMCETRRGKNAIDRVKARRKWRRTF
ncbi:MAG: hypothetical protein WC683_07740 [bacterium]